jgi:hypothetical protein
MRTTGTPPMLAASFDMAEEDEMFNPVSSVAEEGCGMENISRKTAE